jgi:di/tripeptidase
VTVQLGDHLGVAVSTRRAQPRSVGKFQSSKAASRSSRIVQGFSLEDPVRLLEVAHRPAGVLDRREPLLGVVERARRDFGLPIALSSGSTDANAAFERGIPALSIGVAHGKKMHSIEEEISISSLSRGRQQLERVVEVMLQIRGR